MSSRPDIDTSRDTAKDPAKAVITAWAPERTDV